MIPPHTYISFPHHHITLCKVGGNHCRREGRTLFGAVTVRENTLQQVKTVVCKENLKLFCAEYGRNEPRQAHRLLQHLLSARKIILFMKSRNVFWYKRTRRSTTVLIRVLYLILLRASLFFLRSIVILLSYPHLSPFAWSLATTIGVCYMYGWFYVI